MYRWPILLGLLIAVSVCGFADTLKLLDGKVVSGTFLGGDARTIRMEVENKIEMFPISEVESLTFGNIAVAAAPAEKLDPKKAKEQEKARKKAAEEAAKAAKEAEKAAKAAEKAQAAAAKANGAVANVPTTAPKVTPEVPKATAAAPKTGRFGKPAGLGTASTAAGAVSSAPGAAGEAAQSVEKAANTANKAAATAEQAKTVASNPGAAATGVASNAANSAASNAIGSTPGAALPSPTQEPIAAAVNAASTAAAAKRNGRERTPEPAASSSAGGATNPSDPQPAAVDPAPPQPGNDPQPAQATAGGASTASAGGADATGRASGSPPPSAASADIRNADTKSEESRAELPKDVVFRVRMIDTINSEIHRAGETFRASLEDAIVAGGSVIAPKGADVMVRLIAVPASARAGAAAAYSLQAYAVRADNRNVPFLAELVTQPGDDLAKSNTGGIEVFGAIGQLRVPSDATLRFRTITLPGTK